MMRGMRVIALLATYNERRFIEPCLRHLDEQGVEAYLIDNGSTDETVELAKRWLDRNLIGIESFPRGEGDVYSWRALLTRKEELAREMEADWFIHMDPDEIRLPPAGVDNLARALEKVDGEGFNAVNFLEFTFLPTREEPDHDHADFQRTLRTYYPFARRPRHQLKAWKATDVAELAWSAGHEVRFPQRRIHPRPFPMKHYLFLSAPHAIEKYVERHYDPSEIESGWHIWRSKLKTSDIVLPGRDELRIASMDSDLDPSEPRSSHLLAETVEGRRGRGAP
jgi:glycosyltransferase involved in cell wall biosynthesis